MSEKAKYHFSHLPVWADGNVYLGCAFEPEQRFENPDGTDIRLDTDYFSAHRGLKTMPGPFADPAAWNRIL